MFNARFSDENSKDWLFGVDCVQQSKISDSFYRGPYQNLNNFVKICYSQKLQVLENLIITSFWALFWFKSYFYFDLNLSPSESWRNQSKEKSGISSSPRLVFSVTKSAKLIVRLCYLPTPSTNPKQLELQIYFNNISLAHWHGNNDKNFFVNSFKDFSTQNMLLLFRHFVWCIKLCNYLRRRGTFIREFGLEIYRLLWKDLDLKIF